MDTKKKFQISGLITETHGRLRDRMSLMKSDSMVNLKRDKTELPKELNGITAKEC